MTNVIGFEAKEKEKNKEDKIKKNESLFVAGYFTKGLNKGKKIAIQVRNIITLNPVEPIFDAYPDIDCLIITKNETKTRKYFKKLIS